MIAPEYFQTEFKKDLMLFGSVDQRDVSISIASMIDTQPPEGTRFAEHAQIFSTLAYRDLFLFSFFYTSLLDQSIHACLSAYHAAFEEKRHFPKLAGIFDSHRKNLHPALLLLAATLEIHPRHAPGATRNFKVLTDVCLLEIYPEEIKALVQKDEKETALGALWHELSSACAISYCPRSLQPFSKREPDLRIYFDWIYFLNSRINLVKMK